MYLLYDAETTGLPDMKHPADAYGQPRLCSLAAALVNRNGTTIRDFYCLVAPEGWDEQVIQKSRYAFEVNGLSLERLAKEGQPLDDVLSAFDSFVDDCEGIACFGLAFDQKIMRGEHRRKGRPDRYGERPVFCIQQAARPLCRELKKIPTLSEATRILLEQSLEGAHDALVDLRATVAIFNIMRRDGLVVWKQQSAKQQQATE